MKYNIVLASNSPRRKELLAGLDIPFTVRLKQGINETYPDNLPSDEVPLFLSRLKAAAYLDSMTENELILTADTVVVIGQQILGKPKDEDDACRMLRLLSGREHHVVTGVSLTTLRKQRSFKVSTAVTFKTLSQDEISYYVNHYKPFDKAGAYGIQEWIGYVGVTSLRGSYFNVMGLPVQRIYEELMKF